MYCELDHGGGAPLDHVVIQIASGSRVVAVKSGARGSSEKTKARMLGDMEYYGCPVAVRACTREFLLDVEGTEELTLVLGTGGSFTVDWTYDCSFEEDTPPHGKDELGVVTIRTWKWCCARVSWARSMSVCVAQSRSPVASFKGSTTLRMRLVACIFVPPCLCDSVGPFGSCI